MRRCRGSPTGVSLTLSMTPGARGSKDQRPGATVAAVQPLHISKAPNTKSRHLTRNPNTIAPSRRHESMSELCLLRLHRRTQEGSETERQIQTRSAAIRPSAAPARTKKRYSKLLTGAKASGLPSPPLTARAANRVRGCRLIHGLASETGGWSLP